MTPEAAKATRPKFAIEADTFDEFMADVVSVVKESGVGSIDIVKSKKGDGQYGRFQYELEGHDRDLALKAGIPIGVSIQVIWHKLTTAENYTAELARREAATATNIDTLRARLAKLEAQKKASQK